jgi:hypothetical protein
VEAFEILRRVYDAFADTVYPGDEDIIHCEYDELWGGTLDGPCRECDEVVEFFCGSGNRSLDPVGLDWVAFGLASFTKEAFHFWLPAFIEAAILHPEECSHVSESLQFRFALRFGDERYAERLSVLSEHQFDAVAMYFEHTRPSCGDSSVDELLHDIADFRAHRRKST